MPVPSPVSVAYTCEFTHVSRCMKYCVYTYERMYIHRQELGAQSQCHHLYNVYVYEEQYVYE